MLSNPKFIATLVAIVVAAVGLYFTFTLEHSAAKSDDWIINVSFTTLNIGAFVLAGLIYWLGSRSSRSRRAKK